MIHSFEESLRRSNAYSEAAFWEVVYRQAFPNFASMVCVRQDGWAQRAGIDRVIVLSSGKVLTVDEKVRERDWNDFLLERWSDEERRIPGWIAKDLAIDFLAYAFAPSGRCFLLPFLPLRRAWIQRGEEWSFRFPKVRAASGTGGRTWRSVSVAVPIQEVLIAVKDAMCVVLPGAA